MNQWIFLPSPPAIWNRAPCTLPTSTCPETFVFEASILPAKICLITISCTLLALTRVSSEAPGRRGPQRNRIVHWFVFGSSAGLSLRGSEATAAIRSPSFRFFSSSTGLRQEKGEPSGSVHAMLWLGKTILFPSTFGPLAGHPLGDAPSIGFTASAPPALPTSCSSGPAPSRRR